MANTEMTWRKMPRTVFTDPNFDYIASCLPKEYESAPYMFYLVALSVADDDGIFDLEDGIIFSRLMHIDNTEIVFKIANLMMKRKIITRNGNTTICMLTNWEYSIREKPRTLAERRVVVQKQIEAAAAMQNKEFSLDPSEKAEADDAEFTVDFSATPSMDADFLCPENDKNQKNVAINSYDDKTEKNVVENYQTEKIREDKNREIEHTQNRLDTDKTQLRANYEALRCKETDRIEPEYTEEWDGTETQQLDDIQDLAQQALSEGQGVQNDEQQNRLFSVFEAFFAKNCLGFNVNVSRADITVLCLRVLALSDAKNPPEIIASCIVSQFKKLSEDDPYFKNMPLTPESLLIPNTWRHVLAAASRILLASKQVTPAWMKQLQEAEEEKAQVGDGFDAEYIKYGIDPGDPNKAALLLRAKAAASPGNKGP